jgi:membrane protease YdiL (CAAX protease family)
MNGQAARPLFGWCVLGGCYGVLWYLLLDLPLSKVKTNLTILNPWNPVMIPASFFIGALFIGALFEELASRRWIPRQRVFWVILAAIAWMWFHMLLGTASP